MAKSKKAAVLVPVSAKVAIVSGKPLELQPGFKAPLAAAIAAQGTVFSQVREAVTFGIAFVAQTAPKATYAEQRGMIGDAAQKVIGSDVNAKTLRVYVESLRDAGIGRLAEGATVDSLELPKTRRDAFAVIEALTPSTRARIGRKEKRGNRGSTDATIAKAKAEAEAKAKAEAEANQVKPAPVPEATTREKTIADAMNILLHDAGYRLRFQAAIQQVAHVLAADIRARVQAEAEAEAEKKRVQAEAEAKAKSKAEAKKKAKVAVRRDLKLRDAGVLDATTREILTRPTPKAKSKANGARVK